MLQQQYSTCSPKSQHQLPSPCSPPRLTCRKSSDLSWGASCKTLEMLQCPEPDHLNAILGLWNQIQCASGPCQVWATCDHDNRFNVAFLSTSVPAWINYAYRYEDKVLLGVLSCMVKGRKRYFKVIRIGKNVPEDIRMKAERLDRISFENVFGSKVDDLAMHPDDDHSSLSEKICQRLECEQTHVRL